MQTFNENSTNLPNHLPTLLNSGVTGVTEVTEPIPPLKTADFSCYPADFSGVTGVTKPAKKPTKQAKPAKKVETTVVPEPEVAALEIAVVAENLPESKPETEPETSVETSPGSLIPGASDRPRFIVFDDGHSEGAEKFRPGVWLFSTRANKGDAPPTLTQKWVCSPMHIEAITSDGRGWHFGRLLRFKDTYGGWRQWAMPMELLAGDGIELRSNLLSMGVGIEPDARTAVLRYIQTLTPKKRLQCALQTGWAADNTGAGGKAFVLPSQVIGPHAGRVIYQSTGHDNNEYATAGSLPLWQASVAAMAVGNPLLVLGLCSAFAGPLLALCNQESGGIHFVGDSSTGKTTIIEVACSVWGGAGFKRSWRTTGNGLEGVAALFNDGLLALDELSECDPRQVGEVIYMLGNGRGKQRAGRSGMAKPVQRWRCSVLSSGERTIATAMEEAGHSIKAGVGVRLLDIPVQRTHGAWDNLHQAATGHAFSDALKRAATANYGHAGPAFLEHLTREESGSFTDALEAVKVKIHALANTSEVEDGQVKRVLSRFAVLALAGELATGYSVTGWQAGEATNAAAAGFAAWAALRGNDRLGNTGNTGNTEQHQVTQAVTAFIERHGDSRFSDADAGDGVDSERINALVRDRAGWFRRESSGNRVYLFTGSGLKEALKGHDFSRAQEKLQAAGFIGEPGADGKRAKNTRVQGRQIKLYAVRTEGVQDTAL